MKGSPLGAGTKDFSNGPGHMTKIAAMPIYGKNTLKNLLQNQKADDLGLDVVLGMWALPS